MKEKQHKLIDLIFDLDEKADNQASKGAKPKKIVCMEKKVLSDESISQTYTANNIFLLKQFFKTIL